MKLLLENWKSYLNESEDYRGQHGAPDKDSGSPLWNVEGAYPKDFYSSQGFSYYRPYEDYDMESYSIIKACYGRRDKQVKVYRAVPKNVSQINVGDWVTISRQYAVDHGESALKGEYKILSKAVPARDLFTSGDSFHEWGYDPQPYTNISEREPWEKWPGKKTA